LVTDKFLNDDFLLSGETARWLFHEVAAAAPIVDIHTHLSAADIADDRVYQTLTELWLEDDHYKWRAMRLAGWDEQLITGSADPWDKFMAWARTLPRLVHNPLYVWTHLELRRVFGIDVPLSERTAREIWDEANWQLPRWSVRRLLTRFSVATLATTDDPADDLAAHSCITQTYAGDRPVVPTWRPDAAHRLLCDPLLWNAWADRLGTSAGLVIDDLESLMDALSRSYRRFADHGGRASDHGLRLLPDVSRDPAAAEAVVRSVRGGTAAGAPEQQMVMLEVLHLAARLACGDGSVLQLHLGPWRDVSPRLLAEVGRDAGGDAIGDDPQGPGLARYLGELEAAGHLPRVLLYNANPRDNALFIALAGAFSRPGVPSLVQWGPPWWFNDHEDGIRHQLEELGQVGQLAGFVGMLTDSRSFLSMTRHELFRRILCDLVGRDVDAGRIPPDRDWLARLVDDLCAANTARFFGLEPPRVRPWA
jgi:glucuronate isomerase